MRILDSETLGLWESYKRMCESHDHDVAQAVAIERNMTATWLDKLGDDEMWADIAIRYHLAAEAIRNGEHVKEEA